MVRAVGIELTIAGFADQRDIAFEAAVLRGGLLLGLMHEQDVPEWAVGALGMSASLDAALAEVCLAPIELSAMREALYPVSRDADRARVAAALLTLCGVVPSSVEMPVADRVQQLQLLRHEFRLTGGIVTGILQFEQRGQAAPDEAARGLSLANAFTTWLDTVRAPGFFRCHFTSEADATAFISAIVAPTPPASATSTAVDTTAAVDTTTAIASPCIVILDESVWTAAMRGHGPLPVASRIPGPPPSAQDSGPRHASSLPHPA